MAAGREQSRGGEWGAGCGASIRWVSTIARACWTRKFVWQVACGKSIERGGGTKANAFRMLSSLNRQFRVQSSPPPVSIAPHCIFLLAIFRCPIPCTCLPSSLPAWLSSQEPICLALCLSLPLSTPIYNAFCLAPATSAAPASTSFHQHPAPATAPSPAAAAAPAPTTFRVGSWFAALSDFECAAYLTRHRTQHWRQHWQLLTGNPPTTGQLRQSALASLLLLLSCFHIIQGSSRKFLSFVIKIMGD